MPNDIMFGERTTEHGTVGRLALRFKEVCKRGLKFTGIDSGSWEPRRLVPCCSRRSHERWEKAKRTSWRSEENTETRERERDRKQSQNFVPRSSFVCHNCRSGWHTKIGLLIKNKTIEFWRYHYLANINRFLLFTEIGHEISPSSENLTHYTACKSLYMNDITLKLHYITLLLSLNSESDRFYKVIFVADLNWRQRDWDY